jgi:hypothetical protein
MSNADPHVLFPPLPDLISPGGADTDPVPPNAAPPILPPPHFFPLRSLRCGCYLVNYAPSAVSILPLGYDGTIRVECHSAGRTASGDLYQRPTIILDPVPGSHKPGKVILGAAPSPANGIPILPRARYRYYLRITQLLEGSTLTKSFTLGFEMHRFSSATSTWTNEGTFTAVMTWTPAPAGFPSSNDYLSGIVKNSANVAVGTLTMGWISKFLRKATIEVDRVAQADPPLDNGAGFDWKAAGNSIDWDYTVSVSETNIPEPSGESWSDAECHASMLAHRDASNLDAEWRYHILAVRLLDSTPRGIMYDAFATDSNNVPREGAAIAANWTIPNTPDWGQAQGKRFGSVKAAYFRAIVHECGHAMGLYHNTIDNGFMNTTDVIASNGTAAQPFPTNIQWSFAADDQKRLRHMPDIYVRPGGTPFGTDYAVTPISPTDLMVEAPNLTLTVSPLLESVPMGAPVRINLVLTNIGTAPVEAPEKLSLKSDFVRGEVTDPSGTVRAFSPLILCLDEAPLRTLNPGASINGSLTLLRGGQGALFPSPGLYKIHVDVHWDAEGSEIGVAGETRLLVTAVRDESHASAALAVLSEPDTLLTLAIGGDHLTNGIAAVHAALQDDILRPHYAHIEAKRLAQRFRKRKPDLKGAADLIDADTVMTPAEIKKAAELVAADASTAGAKALAKKLKSKIGTQDVSDDVKRAVQDL